MSVLLPALCAVTFIQVFYFLFFFSRISFHRRRQFHLEEYPPVSVIICARNEVHTLRRNLTSILEQDYPAFEIIVVNDNSEDETEPFLMQLQLKYPGLVTRHLVQGSNTLKGKKYPLTVGLRAAKNELVLLTDADCSPAGSKWIRSMVEEFRNSKKEIVLGFSPFRKTSGFLNRFIRFEAFLTAIQYLSFAKAGIPYMGVGRNLAYKKEIFFRHNIFPKFPKLLSGDDDLLINAAASAKNTAITLHQSSFMFTEAKKSWEEYWFQKQRHVTTSRHYKWKHKFLLGTYSISQIAFYPLLLLLVLYSPFPLEAALLFGIRFFIQAIIYFTAMKKLGEEDLFWLFPVMDVLFLIYYVKLFPGLLQAKRSEWK